MPGNIVSQSICISLHCELDPIQYREYKCGHFLLSKIFRNPSSIPLSLFTVKAICFLYPENVSKSRFSERGDPGLTNEVQKVLDFQETHSRLLATGQNLPIRIKCLVVALS